MNSSHDNQLDRLLENWADKSAAGAKDLAALRQQIVQQLADGNANVIESPSRTGPWRFAVAGLATAAALLVSIGVWRYQFDEPSRTNNLPKTEQYDWTESLEAHRTKPLHRYERLLEEYREVFGNGLAWVAETKQSCKAGLVAANTKNVMPSEYVVIRLRLVARNQQDGQSVVHAVSVLVGCEEMVEIPATVGGGQLVLWAYPVDDKMISIDLRYQPSSVAGTEIDCSNLQRVGQMTNIHSFEKDGVEYRLYQTADLIHHKLG